jgi:hypothetical protein
MYLVVFYVGEYVWVCGCVVVWVWVCGCVYKIENFRTLSAPSEIASLREAISSSAAFEKPCYLLENVERQKLAIKKFWTDLHL